jgi:hypothetical protein
VCDQRMTHPSFPRDLLEPDRVGAAISEQPQRRVEQVAPSLGRTAPDPWP